MSDEPWYMAAKDAHEIIISRSEAFGDDMRTVGVGGVTAIKRVPRDGMHSHIPHLEVWRGDVLAEEYCQHSIVGVRWIKPQPKYAVLDDDMPF